MFLQFIQTGEMMMTMDSDKVCIYNVIFRTITKKYRDIGLKPLNINQDGTIKCVIFFTKRQEKEISETKNKPNN